MAYIGSVVLVAISLVAYQLAQRAVSGGSNPWSPLFVAYVIGVVICGTALLITAPSIFSELRGVSPASLVLGLSVVGIEFGYLQAHRAGWNPAAVGLVGSVAGTAALAVIAAVFLDSPLSPRQLVGIGCCVIGLVLLIGRVN